MQVKLCKNAKTWLFAEHLDLRALLALQLFGAESMRNWRNLEPVSGEGVCATFRQWSLGVRLSKDPSLDADVQ